jgi:hypothetical protein
MPRPVIEFLITEAHRSRLRVVAHTHALSDFKRTESALTVDAFPGGCLMNNLFDIHTWSECSSAPPAVEREASGSA